jgi:hypothetical protein
MTEVGFILIKLKTKVEASITRYIIRNTTGVMKLIS